MKCYRCNGSGVDDDNILCYRCGGKGEIELTNDEWRKTCSTEEFAEWLAFKRKLLRIPETNYEVWIQWLKEEHNG